MDWRSLCVLHSSLSASIVSDTWGSANPGGRVSPQCGFYPLLCCLTKYAKACVVLDDRFTLFTLKSALPRPTVLVTGGDLAASPHFSQYRWGPTLILFVFPDIQTGTKLCIHTNTSNLFPNYSISSCFCFSGCIVWSWESWNALQSIYKPSPSTGSQLHVHAAMTVHVAHHDSSVRNSVTGNTAVCVRAIYGPTIASIWRSQLIGPSWIESVPVWVIWFWQLG